MHHTGPHSQINRTLSLCWRSALRPGTPLARRGREGDRLGRDREALREGLRVERRHLRYLLEVHVGEEQLAVVGVDDLPIARACEPHNFQTLPT